MRFNRRKTMKMLAALCVSSAMGLMLMGCGQPDTHDADVKAIKDTETQWNKDFAAKDAVKLVDHYASDAILIAPGMPPSSGTTAIGSELKGMVADPALSLTFQASKVEVAKSGDIGYTQGSYTLTATDPQTKQVMNDHGSYVTTYRKQADGTWKAVVDIVSSEVPMAAPPVHAAAKGKAKVSAAAKPKKKKH
jgi:uncharacterized protein (TIGR02246 family)